MPAQTMDIKEAKKVLGIKEEVTAEGIRRAYRKMARKYHPDLYQKESDKAWATEKFQIIGQAYQTLMKSVGPNNSHRKEKEEEFPSDEPDFFFLFSKLIEKMPTEGFLGIIFRPIEAALIFPVCFLLFFVGALIRPIFDHLETDPSRDGFEKTCAVVFLLASTLMGLLYLWRVYSSLLNDYDRSMTERILLSTILSAGIIIFMISEWISFFNITIKNWIKSRRVKKKRRGLSLSEN